jgi:sugar phosphate isomerase/epimerase
MPDSPALVLSGFADEAADQKLMEQQFASVAALGLRYLSIRFLDAGQGIKNVMQLDSSEIFQVKNRLREYGLSISSIGSPIGKTKLLDREDGSRNSWFPFESYLQNDVRRACQLANEFDAKLVRGFSFYHPRGEDPAAYLAQAIDQLGRIADECERHGLTYGVEVEANLIGQTGQILAEIHRQVASPALVLVFDGANLVTQGFSPDEVFDQYLAMKPGLGWIHVKDFRRPGKIQKAVHIDEESLRHFVPCDLGDSGHARILQDLKNFLPTLAQRGKLRGVPGVFADLEPHLKGGGQFGGYSGPDGFGVALRSFCRLCDNAGIKYHLRDFGDIQQDRGY